MDALNAKAISDLQRTASLNEDAFYERHSYEWLHRVRAFVSKAKNKGVKKSPQISNLDLPQT